jgi:hypothetical protein
MATLRIRTYPSLFVSPQGVFKIQRQVGFDLVNVQIPLKLLDPSIAERITWVHGNLCVLVACLFIAENM